MYYRILICPEDVMNMYNKPVDLWVSHSSISDFLKCPRLYYLRNIYKDPKTNRKINIINPALSLGQVVHEVLESLSFLPAEKRFQDNLLDKYDEIWLKVSGRKGGFASEEEEKEFKERGKLMINMVIDNSSILKNKALRLKSPDNLPPRFYLSETEGILLCGKVDWLEYISNDDTLHIIDFKTGKVEENPSSLQLAIYCLLVENLQKRKVSKVSYWYLEKDKDPVQMPMPDCEEAKEELMEIALRIKTVRQNQLFDCRKGGCYACNPFEAIINEEAEFIEARGYQDCYIIN